MALEVGLEETEQTPYQSGLGALTGPSASGRTCFPWAQEEWDNEMSFLGPNGRKDSFLPNEVSEDELNPLQLVTG